MSSVNFAAVREDPKIEERLIDLFSPSKVLLIGSGGCTALHLLTTFRGMDLTLFDSNSGQLDLIRRKIAQYNERSGNFNNLFNVESDSKQGLNQLGVFESLFRTFRGFINEFVVDNDRLRVMLSNEGYKAEIIKMFECPYWQVAFELFFSDSILNAMFGPAATQNAPKGSYPVYFRRAFETALTDDNASKNYFLHHVFLGCYLNNPQSLPEYLKKVEAVDVPRMIHGDIYDIKDLNSYDLISLSNILDWLDIEQVKSTAAHLNAHAKQNAIIFVRQLNSEVDLGEVFGSGFANYDKAGDELLRRDRSMFYSKFNVLRKL